MYELKTAEKRLKAIDALIGELTWEKFAELVYQYCHYVPVERFAIGRGPLEKSIITEDYDGIFCVEDDNATNKNCYHFLFLKKRDGFLYALVLFFGIGEDTNEDEVFYGQRTLSHSIHNLTIGKTHSIYKPVYDYNDALYRYEFALYYFFWFFVNQEYKYGNFHDNVPFSDMLERCRAECITEIKTLRIEREKKLETKKMYLKANPLESVWRLKKGRCIFCRCRCSSDSYDVCGACMPKLICIFKFKHTKIGLPNFSVVEFEKLKKATHAIQCSLCGSKKFAIQAANSRMDMCARCDGIWKIFDLGPQMKFDEQTHYSCKTMIETIPLVQKIVRELDARNYTIEEALFYIRYMPPERITEYMKQFGITCSTYAIPSTASALQKLNSLYLKWVNKTIKNGEYRPNQDTILERYGKTLASKDFDFLRCFDLNNKKRRLDEFATLLKTAGD